MSWRVLYCGVDYRFQNVAWKERGPFATERAAVQDMADLHAWLAQRKAIVKMSGQAEHDDLQQWQIRREEIK